MIDTEDIVGIWRYTHTHTYIYIYVPLIFIYNFIHIYTCAYFYNMHTCFEDQSIRGVSPSSTGARRNRLLDSSDYPAEGRWKPCPVQRHGLLMFIDDCCCLYPCCLSPPLLLFCLVKLPLLFGKNHNCLTYPFVLLVCCSDLNWAAQVHVFDHLCWSNPIFVQPIVRRIISILWAGQTCFNGLLTS